MEVFCSYSSARVRIKMLTRTSKSLVLITSRETTETIRQNTVQAPCCALFLTEHCDYQTEQLSTQCIIIVLRAWRRISKPPQVKQSGDVGTLWRNKRSTLKKRTVPITLKKHSGEASEALLAGRCTQLLLVQPSPAAGLLQRHQHFHCQHHHQ